MYPWLKRHKRYLSFRYLFPRVAATWITFRRAVLRLVWFFTHPIDEFLEDVRDVLLWPFAVLYELGRWAVLAIVEFLKDLVQGIEAALGWLGRLQVWTGAALAGVIGIILTILLFFLPALQTAPIPASIRSERVPPSLMSDAASVESPQHSDTGETDGFDPFARLEGRPTVELLPSARQDDEFPFSAPNLPELSASVTRLSMPLGWNARRRNVVDSAPPTAPQRERWMAFDQSTLMDGWQPRRIDRLLAPVDFSPYVSRAGTQSPRTTPSLIAPEDSADPLSRIIGRRQPCVIVEKIAPPTTPAGQPYRYTLFVRNLGEDPLENIQVRERISAIERVTDVQPAANVIGDELVWDVVDLRPGEGRRLQVDVLPNAPLTLAQNTTIQVTTGVGAISEVRHPRPEPPRAEVRPEPAQLPTAHGPEPGSPRMILPEFEPKLIEPAPALVPVPPQSSPGTNDPNPELFPWDFDSVEQPLPQLEPALADEDTPLEQPAEARELFPPTVAATAIPESPLLADTMALAMSTPAAVSSGGSVRTVFELRNRGDEDLSDVVLFVKLSDALQHRHGRSLELRIDRLPAGETYRTRLTTQAVHDGSAAIASRLACAGNVEKTARRELRISPTVAPPADVAFGIRGGCPPHPCFGRRLY